MKNIFYSLAFLFFIIKANAQDTIYCEPYPKGLITNNIKEKNSSYIVYPIDNPNLELTIRKKEVLRINGPSIETRMNNKSYALDKDAIILETNQRTGKVEYTNIIEVSDANIKKLFNSIEGMRQSVITYYLISEDKIDYSYQKYFGKFDTKFAGDRYVVQFNLDVRFKDGKLKYSLTDFIAIFSRGKSSSYTYGATKTETMNLVTTKIIDKSYGSSERNADIKKFWIPIQQNIQECISTIKQLASEATSKKEGW